MHPTDAALNDYVDRTLPSAERAALDRHLSGCDRCRILVSEFAELQRVARGLQPIAPPDQVWSRIAAELGRSPARYFRGWPYWLAAAAVLVIALGAGLRYGLPSSPEPQANVQADRDNLAQTVEAELQQAEQHYQRAISGLEQIARTEQGELDPQTAALLQKNLAVIDQAISESRAALKVEPESEPAQQSLLENFKQKVSLLQDTVALINEMRKGDEAGAARVVSGVQ